MICGLPQIEFKNNFELKHKLSWFFISSVIIDLCLATIFFVWFQKIPLPCICKHLSDCSWVQYVWLFDCDRSGAGVDNKWFLLLLHVVKFSGIELCIEESPGCTFCIILWGANLDFTERMCKWLQLGHHFAKSNFKVMLFAANHSQVTGIAGKWLFCKIEFSIEYHC